MVSSLASSVTYAGNASTVTEYPIPFPFLDAAHIKLAITPSGGAQSVKVNPTDYTVTATGVKTTAAWAASASIFIYRLVPLDQPATFPNAGHLDSTGIERALDRAAMVAQQQQRRIEGGTL